MSKTSDTNQGKADIIKLCEKAIKEGKVTPEIEGEADTIACKMWDSGRGYDAGWDSD